MFTIIIATFVTLEYYGCRRVRVSRQKQKKATIYSHAIYNVEPAKQSQSLPEESIVMTALRVCHDDNYCHAHTRRRTYTR